MYGFIALGSLVVGSLVSYSLMEVRYAKKSNVKKIISQTKTCQTIFEDGTVAVQHEQHGFPPVQEDDADVFSR